MSFPSAKQVAFTTPAPESFVAQKARERAHREAQAKREKAFEAMQAALHDLVESSPADCDDLESFVFGMQKRARAALALAEACK